MRASVIDASVAWIEFAIEFELETRFGIANPEEQQQNLKPNYIRGPVLFDRLNVRGLSVRGKPSNNQTLKLPQTKLPHAPSAHHSNNASQKRANTEFLKHWAGNSTK